MAKKFVSLSNLSKKKQREINSAARKTWSISPVTKAVKDKKKYNRNDYKIRGGNYDN